MRRLVIGLGLGSVVLWAFPACASTPASSARPVMALIATPTPTPAPATRLAVASTNVPGAVRVQQLVEFNADGRVVGVCLVIVNRDSSRIYLPFADSALGRPSLQPPRCQ
jgi:hypothetical protein